MTHHRHAAATRRQVLATAAALALWPVASRAGAYEDFFRAVVLDNAHGVGQLLARGFDANARDEKGQPALLLAMREGSFKVAELLMQQPGIDVNALNFTRENALMMAALQGHVAWVRKLLDTGAQLEKPSYTPLHYAATGPESAAVQVLLDRGAQIDARATNGNTPLMMAARYGSEASVTLLLERGADIHLRNDRDQTAVDFARTAGRDLLAKLLEKRLAKSAP